MRRLAMPSLFRNTPPGQPKEYRPAIQKALDSINPDYPNPERHRLSDDAHCANPKCGYELDDASMQQALAEHGFVCPQCGFHNQFGTDQTELLPQGRKEQWERGDKGSKQPGLSVGEMGLIGEQVIVKAHEIPGVGVVEWYHDGGIGSNFPIDVIITSERGRFGCEIKSANSAAQPAFPAGGRKERMEKLNYCYAHGLKPALIGVRLNFFNNKANIFFREGTITNTDIGNKDMHFVATVDFEDLNPFRSPDPEAQALAVENAKIPDFGDADIDDVFGPVKANVKTADESFEKEHPRDKKGEFTFKHDVHELKVVDKHGKHVKTIKRCIHCGVTYKKPAGYKGRVECPTCGEDPERKLKTISKVVTSDRADNIAKQMGWTFLGRNQQGHRQYQWLNEQTGVSHIAQCGSGQHSKNDAEIDADRLRQRISKCMSGKCLHDEPSITHAQQGVPGAPVIEAGQTANVNGHEYFIIEVDGGDVLVQDMATGVEDILPLNSLRSASEKEPEYMWVYYMGSLRVEKYHHNKKFERMFKELLDNYGVDIDKTMMDIDPTEVAAGEIYEFSDGSIRVDHKQLAREEVRENADRALGDWIREKGEVFDSSEWQDEDEEDDSED